MVKGLGLIEGQGRLRGCAVLLWGSPTGYAVPLALCSAQPGQPFRVAWVEAAMG